jgi:hypothetical protein
MVPSQIQASIQSEYLELKEFSEHYHYGNGTIGFSSSLGDQNVWDGENWQYYIWDEYEKSVRYADNKLYFYDWYERLEVNSQTVIDDCRWIVEYWSSSGGGSWRELDLYNHNWYDPVVELENITFIQGYNDGTNFLNVSYFVTNYAFVKINLDYLSGEDQEIRFVWKLTGIDGSLSMNMARRIFTFDDVIVSCNDTKLSTGFDYEWQVVSKKLDVYLGSFTVGINEWINIDPTYGPSETTEVRDHQVYLNPDWSTYDSRETSLDKFYVGYSTTDYIYVYLIHWATGITDSVTTSSVTLAFAHRWDSVEAGEYGRILLITDYDGDTPLESDSEAVSEDYAIDQATYGSYVEWDGNGNCNADIETLTDYWGSQKGSDEYIKFRVIPGTDMDEGTADLIELYETSYATSALRPTLQFDYEVVAGNSAPVSKVVSAVSGSLYANKSFLFKTNCTDSDGSGDLERAYAGLGSTQFVITFNSSVGVGGLLVIVANGSGYVTNASAVGSSITNGYEITWNISLDWDFPYDDLSTIDTWACARDDEPSYSSWVQDDTNANFENDIEVVMVDIAIAGSAEYGGLDGYVNNSDWFRGGVQVTVSGRVEYEGSDQSFNSSYALNVNVTLFFDEVKTGEGDTVILSGIFDSITYTPTSASGIDTSAYFNVTIFNVPTNGTGTGVEITSKRDNEDPTTAFHSITEDNPHTYIYTTGQIIYFSDNMGSTDQLSTIAVNASDSSGSGIYCVTMSTWDDEAEWNDTTSYYERQYSTDSTETSGSITFYSIDNVGNSDSSPVTVTMTEDTTAPTFSVSPDSDSASIGYAPKNSSYDDDSTIDFTASGASDGSSGLPTNKYSWNDSAWESATTKQYSGQSDGNISLSVYLRDNVGNNATEQTWVVVDTDSPSGFSITWTRMNDTYPFQVYDGNMSIYFDPGNDCNNYTTVTCNDDGTIQNSNFWMVEFDKESVWKIFIINQTRMALFLFELSI